MSSQSNDPIADVAFYCGIIVCAALIALKLATIVWQFLAGIWQASALLFATIISAFYFVSAFGLLRYAPMRTDVDLRGIEDPASFDEELEPEMKKELPKTEVVAPSENKQEKFSYVEDPNSRLESPLHKLQGLSNQEHDFLLQCGYVKREFVPFGKARREWYLIKEQPHKSLEHTFVTHKLIEELRPHVTSVHVTDTQDVAIFHQGTDYLVCVVTPAELRPKSLRRKAEAFRKRFGVNWCFFTTQSAYAKSFERYGSTITRNQIDAWINESFPSKHPSP